MLKFYDEMVIPKVNSKIYNQIFLTENWLRRICLAAYMTKYGDHWEDEVPKGIVNYQSKILDKNRDYFYLDTEDDENIIWLSTYGQLAQLLLSDKVIDNVISLTGFSHEILNSKLNELGAIRNKLAHNRALTETTDKIADGLFKSFKSAIVNFKKQLLYNSGPIHFEDSDDAIAKYYNSINYKPFNSVSNFIAISNEYYQLVALPATELMSYPYFHIGKLLRFFEDYTKYILTFLINKSGDEYSVLIPKVIDRAVTIGIIDRFLDSLYDIRTVKEYTKQDPKDICHPKVWFYENRLPEDI
jgi:hypothetical protein